MPIDNQLCHGETAGRGIQNTPAAMACGKIGSGDTGHLAEERQSVLCHWAITGLHALWSQTRDTASIFGAVDDAQGAAMPGAVITLTTVATGAAGQRRQVVHDVTAKLTNSRMSNPTQVTFQWFVTYRSGRVAASTRIHGTMARLAAAGRVTDQRWRRWLCG